MSDFWKAIFQRQGIKLCMSSSYQLHTDGQTEMVNRTLEQYLRCFYEAQPRCWKERLPWAEFSYNTSHHSTIGITPFEATIGLRGSSTLFDHLCSWHIKRCSCWYLFTGP